MRWRDSVLSTQYSVLSTRHSARPAVSHSPATVSAAYVVVDRLAAGGATEQRVRDSLETAFGKGQGKCFAFVENRRHATRGTEDRHDRRPPVAAAGLQQYLGLRRLRHRIRPARAAAVQFQQPAGGLPELRGLWQYHRRRHGPRRARSEQVAPRRGHRALEHAGLRPRTGRVAGPGPGLRYSRRRAVLEIDRGPAEADRAGRAGAEVRRAGRFLRLAASGGSTRCTSASS